MCVRLLGCLIDSIGVPLDRNEPRRAAVTPYHISGFGGKWRVVLYRVHPWVLHGG